MPYRKVPIVKGEIYHVFNRSVAQEPIFNNLKEYQRALEVIKFYIFGKPPIRFSFYNRLPNDQRIAYYADLVKSLKPAVDIICFCLMPNHVHFLLQNLSDRGTIQFMSNFQNSYAKYFNIRNERTGTLFQPMFKAVRITSEEQLIHVSRYIHLNPITSYILSGIEELKNYQWSSFKDYLSKVPTFIKKDIILNNFRSVKSYERFVEDQIDYQRELNKIKHLILE